MYPLKHAVPSTITADTSYLSSIAPPPLLLPHPLLPYPYLPHLLLPHLHPFLIFLPHPLLPDHILPPHAVLPLPDVIISYCEIFHLCYQNFHSIRNYESTLFSC